MKLNLPKTRTYTQTVDSGQLPYVRLHTMAERARALRELYKRR